MKDPASSTKPPPFICNWAIAKKLCGAFVLYRISGRMVSFMAAAKEIRSHFRVLGHVPFEVRPPRSPSMFPSAFP
jgi:hypothetical protein